MFVDDLGRGCWLILKEMFLKHFIVIFNYDAENSFF